jgi:single-strand DNA-binding protein
MASYNRVILVGNLTRDVELRYIPSGTAVCDVGLAVNDRRKNASGEWIDETTFVDVTLWGRTAEVASEYLNKGSSVLIEGRLKLDTWEKDGKKNSKLRVVGERMQMLGGRGGGGGGGGSRSSAAEPAPQAAARDEFEGPPPDDDIPFRTALAHEQRVTTRLCSAPRILSGIESVL